MEGIQRLHNGLHSDHEPAMQPNDTVRDALNGSLIAYGNNRFAYESVRGNKVSFTLPSHSSLGDFTVIGWYSFTDRLIIFSTIGFPASTFYGEIGEVIFDNEGNGTYLQLYFHASLNFTKDFPIRNKDGFVGKPETSRIKRIYWTDRNNPLRSFNILDYRLRDLDGTINTVPSGSLVVGNRYMVLRNGVNNNITHNAVVYGPGETAGNVFTAVNANYTGSGNVVEYIPLETLDVVPTFDLGYIDGKAISFGGSLSCGSYQYFYRLLTADGGFTNWSYVTRPFYVPNSNTPTDQSISYAEHQGASNSTNSTKYITLNINGIDTNFYKIEVGFIRGTDYKVYEVPKVFYKAVITGASMDINHFGNETTTSLTLNDITIPILPLDFVGSITSTKDILFVADIGLQDDPDFDMSPDVTCDVFNYLIPADILGDIDHTDTIAAGFAVHGHGRVQSASVGNTVAYPGQYYEVIGDGSNYVTYNGDDYYPGGPNGEFFIGIGGVTAITVTGTGKAVAIIRLQKYTGEYKNIRIENDFADLKGFLASHYLLSNWRAETYRYGIMLWSKNGVPLYVHFLCDKTMPQVYESFGELIGYDSGSGDTYLALLGAKFSDLDFNLVADGLGCTLAELPNFISGWSIVRCERDQQIVAQGLLFPTMVNGTATEILSISQLIDDQYYDGGATNLGRRPNVYVHYSPDNLCGFDGRPNYAVEDKMKIVGYYGTTDGAAAGIQLVTDAVIDKKHYYKYYDATAPNTPGTLYDVGEEVRIIDNCFTVVGDFSTGVSLPSFGLPGVFNNRGTWDDAGSARIGYGVEVVAVKLEGDEATQVFGFGDHESGTLYKPLVNQVREKSNLYGGTSSEAKAANRYIWCGHFQAMDSDFMSYLTGNSGIVDNVEVLGGDSYVNLVDFCRLLTDFDLPLTVGFGAVFPCESNVNYAMREGRTLNKNRIFHPTEASDGITSTASNRKEESFTVRGFYSNKEHQVFYLPRPVGFLSQSRDQNLIRYSEIKIAGELVDSWRRFLVNNNKATDGQYGGITNIVAKASRLFALQNRGISWLPVNERTMITNALGEAIQLGVGGTLERNDEIDYFYGNQHGFSLMEGEDYLAWFDFRRRAVIRMGFGGGVDSVGMVDGLRSFFHTVFDNIEDEASPNIFDSDNPITGMGIVGCYDSRFRMGFMTFKYSKDGLEQDFTLGFSHDLSKYIGFFSFTPAMMIEHNGFMLATKVARNEIVADTEYFVGDELTDTSTHKHYVCIVDYVSATPTPTQPGSDSTHWELVSSIDDIHVQWRNDICKFFGIVYPYYVTVIVKDSVMDNIAVDNLEVAGNDTNFTDVYVENGEGSASDENIGVGNRNYKYYDGGWKFNIPLKNKRQRLVDHYLQIKMRVKNYVGDAVTTSLNEVKRIFLVKSSYRKKL